jgi:hypothetical protein
MTVFRRSFSSAVVLLQQTSHFLYPSVDWVKVEAGHYAIVDPIDNHAILYLPEKTYHIQVRVSLNTETPIVVLARPGDKQLEPTTKVPKPETPPIPYSERSEQRNMEKISFVAPELIDFTNWCQA